SGSYTDEEIVVPERPTPPCRQRKLRPPSTEGAARLGSRRGLRCWGGLCRRSSLSWRRRLSRRRGSRGRGSRSGGGRSGGLRRWGGLSRRRCWWGGLGRCGQAVRSRVHGAVGARLSRHLCGRWSRQEQEPCHC